MNEHEATALLEALVDPLEVGTAPTEALVARGRRTQARRRAVTVLGGAAAVAVTLGGVAVVAGLDRNGSGGPDRPAEATTAPFTPKRVWDNVTVDDLSGHWRPVSLLGEPVPQQKDWTPDGIYFDNRHRLATTTPDGCGGISGIFRLWQDGRFCPILEEPFYGYGCGRHAHPEVLNEDVLTTAYRVQVVAGVLTFYDANDTRIATYHRHWKPVDTAALIGSWKPTRLFGQRPSIQGMSIRSMPVVIFRADSYTAEDGINLTHGRYAVGRSGGFRSWDESHTLVACGPTMADCGVGNPGVLIGAARLQLRRNLLTFHDADGTEIGRYQRVG
jgi:hypothetical protein